MMIKAGQKETNVTNFKLCGNIEYYNKDNKQEFEVILFI